MGILETSLSLQIAKFIVEEERQGHYYSSDFDPKILADASKVLRSSLWSNIIRRLPEAAQEYHKQYQELNSEPDLVVPQKLENFTMEFDHDNDSYFVEKKPDEILFRKTPKDSSVPKYEISLAPDCILIKNNYYVPQVPTDHYQNVALNSTFAIELILMSIKNL